MTAPIDDPAPSRRSRARALDEDVLEEIVARVATLPEPLAALALEIEVARDEGDATGVRKRLYELGAALARYGVSFGLAALWALSPERSASGQLAEALQRAFRLTDGRWLDLARLLGVALKRASPAAAKCLAFASSPALAAMIASRNGFIHSGGSGDDAPERTLAALDAAAALLELPLRVVVGQDPTVVQVRHGVPRRKGVFRRTEEPLAGHLGVGSAFVVLGGAVIPLDPWLPMLDDGLVLVDCPPGPGRSWRGVSPETGEHRDHAALDAAVRGLVGADAAAPRPPVDRPRLSGREVEGALVLRALGEAAGGSVRSVVLCGAQGSGLSRMLSEAAGAAVGLGFSTVLEVHGSADRRAPFGALRAGLQESPAPGLADLRDAIERLTTSEDLADRARLDAQIEALEERLLDLARRAPLVVLIDDAQWLDPHTLALLRLLVERSTRGAKASLALFVAARAEQDAQPGLASLLLAVDRDVGAGATRVPLEPLAPEATRRLVEGVGSFAPAVVERVLRGASGVPFFVVQPLLVWVETGVLDWQEGVWAKAPGERGLALDGPVPGLAELVDARVSALFDRGSDAEAVAHWVLACVTTDASATSPSRVLAVLGGLGAPPALAARVLDALLDAGVLLRRDGAVDVPQPIVAEALAARYRLRADAEALERALLAVLEAEPPRLRDPERLARGLDRVGEATRAARWYREAIAERVRQGAFEGARALAERLAVCDPTRAGRLRAELAAVDALKRNGELLEAERRCAAVAPSADPALELERRLAEESVAALSGRAAIGDLDQLVTEADRLGQAGARVAARLLVARRRRGAAGRAAVSAALAVLEDGDLDADDDRYRLLALDLELVYETRDGGVEALRRAAARARSAARDLGSTWAELDVANDAAILEADAGELDVAIAALADVAERAGRAHFGSLRRLALTNAAALELRALRPDAAGALARTAEAESRAAGDERFLAAALAARAESELARGDAAAALLAINEALELRERARDKANSIPFLRRADVRERLDDHEGARADAELALARARESGNPNAEALARLWLALHAVRVGAEGALVAGRALVAELSAVEATLNAPSRKRLAFARELLAAHDPS